MPIATVLPVRLKYAISQFSDAIIGGENVRNTYAKVKVKNFGFQRSVIFFYKNNESAWNSEPLILDANYGDYEIYTTKNIPLAEEFAIKYRVDDIEYWDNNNGNNYQLITNRVNNIISGNVVLHKAIAKTDPEGGEVENKQTWLEGEIYVRRKTSYSKRVGIKISADNGNSWEEVNADYQYPVTEGSYIDVALGELEVELWTFKTPAYNYQPDADLFKFAVYYQNLETGEFHWDNNFEQDYKISKIYGSTIE